ncbi:MAG: DUF309 domain-containing protein [Deltaproteobacteria bacterium]|jgi:hypothetical protein|nr:DUF309 domain-containing protein [Deltaproteobacteria bacterium]
MIEQKNTSKTRERFDPFTDRTARDMRNALSEAFVAALDAKNPDGVGPTAQRWREQNLSSIHSTYIDTRLRRYRHVFNAIRSGNVNDPLQQALIIWNQGLFFEFHDHLEAIWKSATGDKRQALKGLIKAAGVYIHLEQKHQQAAQSLAAKALALLLQHRHCLTFMANPETLLNKLKTIDPDPPQLDIASFAD